MKRYVATITIEVAADGVPEATRQAISHLPQVTELMNQVAGMDTTGDRNGGTTGSMVPGFFEDSWKARVSVQLHPEKADEVLDGRAPATRSPDPEQG